MNNHICRVCKVKLDDINCTSARLKNSQYICDTCEYNRKRKWYIDNREYELEKVKKYQQEHYVPKSPHNRNCSQFLGIHVAERVLSYVFENVKRMPNNNPGFDFICGKGYKIDVKSSVRLVSNNKYSDRWMFNIKRNKIADYFILLAFDNRDDLNPEYIWLFPANEISDTHGLSIGESTIHKWDEYKINNIDKVINCCDTIKSIPTNP